MTSRRVFWCAVILAAVALAAVSIPSSPVHLATLIGSSPQYDGKSVSEWLEVVDQGDSSERRRALFALGAIGEDAEAAIPALARVMVEDADPRLRNEASLALSKIGPATSSVIPELTKALGDEEPFIRMNAARTLFRLKEVARPAVPALIVGLEDPGNDTNLIVFTYTVQGQMALALGRASAGTDEGVPALQKALREATSDAARTTIVFALAAVGPNAAPALADLRSYRESPNADLRWAVEDALKSIEVAGAAP